MSTLNALRATLQDRIAAHRQRLDERRTMQRVMSDPMLRAEYLALHARQETAGTLS